MCYFNLENLARDAGRTLMLEGLEAAKKKIQKVIKSTIYDADVEDFDFSYDFFHIEEVAWEEVLPHRRPMHVKAAVLRHSLNLGGGIFKPECQENIIQMMKEDMKKMIEKHRTDFYRSTLARTK